MPLQLVREKERSTRVNSELLGGRIEWTQGWPLRGLPEQFGPHRFPLLWELGQTHGEAEEHETASTHPWQRTGKAGKSQLAASYSNRLPEFLAQAVAKGLESQAPQFQWSHDSSSFWGPCFSFKTKGFHL